MASETSGDFVGACEHPTRIPTTSSASEAKYTGKVLILDLLNHASSCFDRMHTLLPHSAPRPGGLGTCPVLAWKSAACGWRCQWRQSRDYITARPKPEGDGRPVLYEQRQKTKRAPDRAARVSLWALFVV